MDREKYFPIGLKKGDSGWVSCWIVHRLQDFPQRPPHSTFEILSRWKPDNCSPKGKDLFLVCILCTG